MTGSSLPRARRPRATFARGPVALAWVVALACAVGCVRTEQSAAATLDARGVGMGGVAVPAASSLLNQLNPAYRAVPPADERARRTLSLPLGLAQTAVTLPPLDPDAADLEAGAILQLCADVPWSLLIMRPDNPLAGTRASGDDSLTIPLSHLREGLPAAQRSMGNVLRALDLGVGVDLGARAGVIDLALLQPFIRNSLSVSPDAALGAIVDGGAPVSGGAPARVIMAGTLDVWLSSGIALAREIALPGGSDLRDAAARARETGGSAPSPDWREAYWRAQERRLRVWAGLGYRRLFGVTHADLNGNAGFSANASAPDAVADAGYDVTYTTVAPRFDWGSGQAVDAGLVLRWRDVELGAGIADLLASLTFAGARVDRYTHDAVTGERRHDITGHDLEIESELPALWLINATRTRGRWQVAADARHEPGGTRWHVGSECWVRSSLALRGGVELDQNGALQGGIGVGLRELRGGGLGLDVGVASQAQTVTGERALLLALSLLLP